MLIRTHFSGVSVGTEFALIRNKISWGPYPLCTGYQSTGVIEQLGSEVEGYHLGDKVYVRGGDQMSLNDGTAVSMVSGTHSSHILRKVNTAHAFERLPEGVDMATASLFVMPSVGYAGVEMAQPGMGDIVVIYGCGMIGLGALAACAQRGCEVIAVDVNDKALKMAKIFGASHLINAKQQNVAEEVLKIAPAGADVVFECTGIVACVNPAIELCRGLGSFVWQGNYGDKPVPLNFGAAHVRRLKMFFPCDDGLFPCRRGVLKQMASGSLPWEKTITHRIDYTQAPGLYQELNHGLSDAMGMVINWEKAV